MRGFEAATVSAVLALGAATASVAQTAPVGNGVVVFAPEAFASAAPATAGDMLARVPGFTVVEADDDVRGYAGALGNVLIDGARPSSKREDIGDILDRIPAASVERIELIRGGVPGVDMAGYPVVANIVRRRSDTVEWAVEGGAIASLDGWSAVGFGGEYSRAWGDRSLELALKVEPDLDDDTGQGIIEEYKPDGALDERIASDTLTTQNTVEASAAFRQPLARGRLTATAGLRREQTDSATRLGDSPAFDEVVDETERLDEAEAGLHFARALSDRLSLVAVASQRLGRLEAREHSVEGADDEAFAETTDTGESIARIDLTWERSDRLSFTAGLEGAFNVLESEARLQENGVPVALPGSDVRIEERRGEASLAATWKPMEGWRLDAGLRVERSAIAQSGDTPLERSFTYAKPRLAATWDATEADRLHLSLSREVGQLDFGDFVASASLDRGVITVGNAELEPDKTWRLTAGWEHRFGDDAALTLTWTHDRIEDVIDRVLIVTPGDVFDAPGNIGDGRRDTLALELTAPLDGVGISGGQLRSSLLWRTSEVTDPVTGERRDISGERPFEGLIELTQDLPSMGLTWGVEIDHIAERQTEYRFDEITRESEGASWTLHVERRIGAHWRLRFEATDLFGRDFSETREKHDGPRSIFPVEEIERRERETPGYVSLTLRRSTGG